MAPGVQGNTSFSSVPIRKLQQESVNINDKAVAKTSLSDISTEGKGFVRSDMKNYDPPVNKINIQYISWGNGVEDTPTV